MNVTRERRPETVPGQRDLQRRLASLVADANERLGVGFSDSALDAAGETLAAIALETTAQLRAQRRRGPVVSQLCELAVRTADLEVDLREHAVQRRSHALAGVESALGRLRCISRPAELVDSVCGELVRSCGFSRAMLSRVEDGQWMPWKTWFSHRDVRESDEDWMTSTRIPLDAMILERELIEQRRAAFVADTAADERALDSFVSAVGTPSYVAAPVITVGPVVGFLHADHYPSERRVDAVDRDILWAFAIGFGRIYERTVLLERLDAQRDHVRATLREAVTVMDNLARAELELARHRDERSITPSATAFAPTADRSAMDDLLTPREREVLGLIVAGQSNNAIAGRLVISEGTVKSHVKQVLRKLGAVNRSEAIARYLGRITSN